MIVANVFADGRIANSPLPATSPSEFTDQLPDLDSKTKTLDSKETSESPESRGDFISDILAFQTAILVLLIPLSFDVISRISERYKSDVIIKHFQKEIIFRTLIFLLFMNIFFSLFLKFFFIENFYLVFCALLLAIASTVYIGLFFWLIMKYTTSIEYVKGKLLNEAQEILS